MNPEADDELSPGIYIEDVTLEQALGLFSFPKDIGSYEEKPLIVGQGRFGPYVKWGEAFISIPRSEDPQAVDHIRAVELIEAESLAGAVQLAAHAAHQGDAVILSPACASFDMFRDYRHRADVYVDAVRELAAEAGQPC